jgi:hypothetical protein
MPEDRLGELCDDIKATLDRCIRMLDRCILLMWYTLVMVLIIFVKVFFYA